MSTRKLSDMGFKARKSVPATKDSKGSASKRTPGAQQSVKGDSATASPTSGHPEVVLELEESDEATERPKKRRKTIPRTRQGVSETKKNDAKEPELDPKTQPRLNIKNTAYSNLVRDARDKNSYLKPVHGEGQNRIHEALRVFDLSYQYGPCVGMTRLERWKRAKALKLNPPQEVYDILTTKEGLTDPEYAKDVLTRAEYSKDVVLLAQP